MPGFLVAQQIGRLIAQGAVIGADIDNCLGPASYQLRVGSYREHHRDQSEALPAGQEIVVQPGGLILVGTLEQVKFASNLIGFLHLRSSYARRGFLPWSQGIIEPGYAGGVTVVLHNHSRDYIPVAGNERICHLVFQLTDERTEKPYKETYLNLPSATAAPANELPPLKVVGARGR